MHQAVSTGRSGVCHATLAQLQLLQSVDWLLGDDQRLQQQMQRIHRARFNVGQLAVSASEAGACCECSQSKLNICDKKVGVSNRERQHASQRC
jgi:hypothetical protein